MTKDLDFCEFSLSWKRPENIPFPNVWRRFQITSNEGLILTVKIQDAIPEWHDEIWEFFVKHHWGELELSKALKMMEDQESMKVLEHAYRRVLKENATLVAVLDEPVEKPTIIGVQIKVIFSKGDSISPKSKREALKKYDTLIEAAMGGIDFFEEFNCDRYFEDYGMCVAPAFRGKKVAENIFESVAEMAKAFKVRGEANMFLNPGLDKLALRVGFKVLRAVKYRDIKDENGEPVVNIGTEYVVCYGRTFY